MEEHSRASQEPTRRIDRADALVGQGDHVRATAEAKTASDSPHVSAGTLYNAACIYSRASGVVRGDSTLSATDREALAERYASRAVELLRQAMAKGYQDVKHVKEDADFAPLRSGKPFKRLLADLEKAHPKRKRGQTP